MRIPTSVLVMSALTALPFGLGIRATLKDKKITGEELDPDGMGLRDPKDRARERAVEAYEAEMRREEAEQEARARARYAKLDLVFDPAKPAQMGSLLAGIQLGSDAGSFQPEHVRERIANATSDGFL